MSGVLLNITFTVISGPIHFILVSTLTTLIFGWKLGLVTIGFTIITRSLIAVLYARGILSLQINFNEYALATPALLSTIVGGAFSALVIVFAIDKFYAWLITALNTLKEKNDELAVKNSELVAAIQKAEENDRLKSVFLANMSHEIRTPMNAIIGFSNFLARPNLSQDRRERYSELVQERSYDLLRIIEDILDISKIENRQLKLEFSEIHLDTLLVEIFEYYNLKLKKTDVSKVVLKLEISENIKELAISSDKQRLMQVINNLLDNAIKFTPKGEVVLKAKLGKTDSVIEFSVSDSGIGIPEDKIDIIFDRFRQADESLAARQYGGSGLGLSISKGILELLGGKIWVESEYGKGSTFNFTLPFQKIEVSEKLSKKGDLRNRNWIDKRVLVVEDDLANSEYLVELLYDTKIQVSKAMTANEVRKLLKNKQKPDIVLMDIRLPDESGIVLTKEIKKQYPKVIVVAQTAYASKEDQQECIDAGCSDFITKPIDQENLLNVIESLLNSGQQ